MRPVPVLPGLLALLLAITVPVGAMLDPSAVYCTASGYEYGKVTTGAYEYGVCRMPDHTYVDSWEFLRGRAGQEFNYCARSGYVSKTSRDARTCSAVADTVCTVCVLPGGREAEVTTLMNLSFAETTCGDGRCVITENFRNCPADCPQSGADDFCQNIFDLKCDPDCFGGQEDPDCSLGRVLAAGMVVALVAIAAVYTFRKRKTEKK